MKYEKCLSCEQLSTTCDGPNLLSMDTIELGLWCNEVRKTIPGMTYDKIAADTLLSKTAVRDFLTGAHDDCSMRTARTIAKYITNGKWDDNPCGNISNNEKAEYEEKVHLLEEKVHHLENEMQLRDNTILHLNKTNDAMQTLITNTNARTTKDKDFLREQVKSKNRAIISLSICLGICMLLIIAALIVDILNSDMGFFWLEGMFKPNGVEEVFHRWNI